MNKKNFVLLSLLFLVSACFMYFFNHSSYKKEVVILGPDEQPIKIKPKDPGGIVIPNSDSVLYNKLKTANSPKNTTNILLSPEEPIEIMRKKEVQVQLVDSIDEILDNIERNESDMWSNKSEIISESASEVPLDASSDGALLENTILKNNSDNEIIIEGSELKIIKAINSRYDINRLNVVSPEQEGYNIQISSAYSLKDAQKYWDQIKQKHWKILSEANLVTRKIDSNNERIFYLVMAGTYPSLNHAKLICKKLAAKKQNCIVTK